jgi:hypothetical protein
LRAYRETLAKFCTAKILVGGEIKKRQFSFEPAVTKSFGARISPWMNIPIAETTGLSRGLHDWMRISASVRCAVL